MPAWTELEHAHEKHYQREQCDEGQPAPREAREELADRSRRSSHVTAPEAIPELFDEDVVEHGYHPKPNISRSWRHSASLRIQGHIAPRRGGCNKPPRVTGVRPGQLLRQPDAPWRRRSTHVVSRTLNQELPTDVNFALPS